MGSESRGDWLWHFAWLVGSSLLILHSAAAIGATFDEPVYITSGLRAWREGNQQCFVWLGTMPLPANVQTFPLRIAELWRGAPLDVIAAWDACLPLARATTLLFWIVLLGFVRRLGRSLGGSWGGRLAVAYLACEPTLLGHAALATTDLALAACWLGFVVTYRERTSVRAAAVWLALCVLAKASGVAFAALAVIAVEIERVVRDAPTMCELPPWRIVDRIAIAALAIVLVFVACGGKPHRKYAEHCPPLAPILRHNPLGLHAWHIVQFQMAHNRTSHGATYLFGETTAEPRPHYFLAALAVKLTLPALAAIALALRPRSFPNVAWLALLLLLLFTPFCRVQIGVRFFTPAIAVALIAAGASLQPRLGLALLSAMLAVALPADGLRYFNCFGGGTERGYSSLSDSNYDWGQGLPELRRWADAHPERPLSVWYFGSDPHATECRPALLPADVASASPDWIVERHGGQYFAVSLSLLYGFQGETPSVRWLRGQTPVGRTGTTFIYAIPTEAGASVD